MKFLEQLNILLEDKRQRVVIVHGWEGSPSSNWLPWLKKELKDVDVVIPSMPEPETPHIDAWVPYLKNAVGKVDEDTFLIGHSIGCQTILRMLADTDGNPGGIVLVAPYIKLKQDSLEGEDEKEIAKEWEDTPLDFSKIDTNCIAIFSDDDPFVSISNSKIFKNKLGAKIVKMKKQGHFDMKELPVALTSLLGMLS